MRIKPDGTLDEIWREPVLWWKKKQEQRHEALRQQLINDMLRNHPGMTREEAQQMIDLFG